MWLGFGLGKYWPCDLEHKQVIFIMFILWIFPISNPCSPNWVSFSNCKVCSAWLWRLYLWLKSDLGVHLLSQTQDTEGTQSSSTHALRQCSIAVLKVFGHNSLSQVICPVNIHKEPESTRQMHNAPQQPGHSPGSQGKRSVFAEPLNQTLGSRGYISLSWSRPISSLSLLSLPSH